MLPVLSLMRVSRDPTITLLLLVVVLFFFGTAIGRQLMREPRQPLSVHYCLSRYHLISSTQPINESMFMIVVL